MTDQQTHGVASSVNTAAGAAAPLGNVPVTVSISLGSTIVTLDSVLAFGEQSLIELDRRVGDPVDVLVNGRVHARGEVVTIGEYFGVRVTEVLSAVQEVP